MSIKTTADMDAFLSGIGMCRKAITKDDTCLFRVVSEKLCYTQHYHSRIRDSCLDYLSRHISDYQPLFEESLQERIKNIRDYKVKPGYLEMIVLARMYRLDFMLFHSPSLPPVSLTQNYFYNQVIVCNTEDSHYDIVYSKAHIEAAGICQAIVYEVLYRGVFGLDSELEEAVMFLELQKHLPKDNKLSDLTFSDVISLFGRDKTNTLQRVRGRTSPPVPYRIAKALHPVLYRNVELDIVQEEKREVRQRTLDACKGFSVGDKCQVVLEDNETHPYNAHIQFIDEQQGTVGLFVEELGVKKSVPVSTIRPLPLQVQKPGDHQPVLPVAELDILLYQKKGKRRKQQQFSSLLTTDDRSGTAVYSYRDRSSSSCSSNNISSTEGSRSTNNITISNSNLSGCPVPSSSASNSYSRNYTVDNNYINRASIVVPVAYQQPCTYSAETGVPGSCYINSASHFNISGNTLDSSSIARFGYAPVGYTPQPGDSGQLVTPVDPNQPHYMMSTGSTPTTQGPMYWMPVVAVPYGSNMGQVNLGWNPSQDPYGKDLPLSDINTLQYFFNLGVEFYRMSTCAQPTSYPSAVIYPSQSNLEMNQPAVPVMMESCGNYTSMAPVVCTETQATASGTGSLDGNTQMMHTHDSGEGVRIVPKTGTIFAVNRSDDNGMKDLALSDQKRSQNQSGMSDCSKNDINDDKKFDGRQDNKTKDRDVDDQLKDRYNEKDNDKGDGVDDDDDTVSEGMDARSDGDSGCPSECADLSPVGGPSSSEMIQSQGGDTIDDPKPRGKRRYYMYGNHKLVKPIKEIPLRFQILLAETSAAKARCEGQPIYMQQQPPPQAQNPTYDYVYYPTSESTQPQLNANATCFIPSQDNSADANMAPAYIPECYNVSPVPGYSVSANMTSHPSNTSSLQPTPLFVPPMAPPPCMPAHTATSQNCQTIIVYSSHSSSSAATSSPSVPNQQIRSVSMPPPFLPPPSLAPPHLEHMPPNSAPCISSAVSQIPRTLPAVHSQPSVLHADHHIKTNPPLQASVTSKPPIVLSVPPPNHTSNIQTQIPQQKPSSNHVTPNSMAPPPNPCRLPSYNNPAYVPLPQPLTPPSSLPTININGSSIQAPPIAHQGIPNSSVSGAPHSVPYSGLSANQYMYIYASPPTGQSATPSHVVYMVNPAYPPTQTYQQPGVLVPSSCPVPVQ